MRRTIKFIAATMGITLTFVLGGVLGARPAGATYCIQLDVVTAQSDDGSGSTSGSGDTVETDSTNGLVLGGNVGGRIIMNPPDPYYSELCLPFGKPKLMASL